MTNPLFHIPVCEIVRGLFLFHGSVSTPENNLPFPCFLSTLPDDKEVPQSCVSVSDFTGFETYKLVRDKETGQQEWVPQVEISVRGVDYTESYRKIHELKRILDGCNRGAVKLPFSFTDAKKRQISAKATVFIHVANCFEPPSYEGFISNLQGGEVSKYVLFGMRYNIIFEDRMIVDIQSVGPEPPIEERLYTKEEVDDIIAQTRIAIGNRLANVVDITSSLAQQLQQIVDS